MSNSPKARAAHWSPSTHSAFRNPHSALVGAALQQNIFAWPAYV